LIGPGLCPFSTHEGDKVGAPLPSGSMQSRRPSRFGGFAICVPRPAVRRRKFRSKVRNRFLILSLPPPIRETGVQLPKLRRCPSATKPNLTLRIALGVGSPYPVRAFSRPNWPRRLPNRAGARLLFRAVRNFDFRASFWSRLADRPSAAPSGRLPGRAGVGSSGLTKSADAVWGTKRRGLWT